MDVDAWAEAFLVELQRRDLIELVSARSMQSVRNAVASMLERDVLDAQAIAQRLIDQDGVADLMCDDATLAEILEATKPRPELEAHTLDLAKAPARNPQMEAAIEATPDDDELRRVYGDWLQERGDPRGTFVAVQAARAERPSDGRLASHEAALVSAFNAMLFPKLDAFPDGVECAWRFGFLDRVEIRSRRGRHFAHLRAILEHPSAIFLREAIAEAYPSGDELAALAKVTLPKTLRVLRLRSARYMPLGDARPLWPSLGNVETLELEGAPVELGRVAAPNLKTLVIGGEVHSGTARAVLSGDLPKLETLTLRRLTGEAPLEASDLAPLLEGRALPSVTLLRVSEGAASFARANKNPRLRVEIDREREFWEDEEDDEDRYDEVDE